MGAFGDADPFASMRERGLVYAYGAEVEESHGETVETIGPWMHDEMGDAADAYDPSWIFFTNFFISRVDWWTSRPEVRSFLRRVDASGNIYKHRWGDAPITTAALKLFASTGTVSRLPVAYAHLSTMDEIGLDGERRPLSARTNVAELGPHMRRRLQSGGGGNSTNASACDAEDTPNAFPFLVYFGLPSDCAAAPIFAPGLGQTMQALCSVTAALFAAEVEANFGVPWSPPARGADGAALDDTSLIAQVCPATCACVPQMLSADAAVLKRLYESAGGSEWANKRGWPDGGCDRHGVTCSVSGAVVSLDLSQNSLTGRVPTQLGRLSHLTDLTLPVRWFDAPALTCLPTAFWPPELVDTSMDYETLEQSYPYKVPLFDCDALAALWASIATAATLPLLALALWALRLRLRRRAASSTSTTALDAACEVGRLLRIQVSGLLVSIGWALAVVGATPLIVVTLRGKPDDAGLLVVLLPFGLILMLLAVPPTAARAITGLCIGFFCVLSALAIVFWVELTELNDVETPGALWSMEVYGWHVPMLVVCALSAAALVPTLAAGRRCARIAMPPRLKLRRLWLALRFFLLGVGAVFVTTPTVHESLTEEGAFVDAIWAVDMAYYPATLNALASFVPAGIAFLVCALIATAANRGRVLRRLGELGKAGGEQQQAAAVAALVGGSNPTNVLAIGAGRFRTLPLDAIAEADLRTNQDTGLHQKTTHNELGSADAFMSHSWSDDGAAKHAELLKWAHKFGERSPVLWLDKVRSSRLNGYFLAPSNSSRVASRSRRSQACIDQADIDANLACLPIFLSGCKELLVLAGLTYHTRLWCVMELFTFLQMGGSVERITVRELLEGARSNLAAFDARKAKCFLRKDRHKLLAVIEAGFGDLQPFNRVVRTIFAERARKRSVTLQAETTPSLQAESAPSRSTKVAPEPPSPRVLSAASARYQVSIEQAAVQDLTSE